GGLRGTTRKNRELAYGDFVIERIALSAEASTVGSWNNADVTGRQLQYFCESAMHIMRSLRGTPESYLVVRIVMSYCRMLLHRQGGGGFVEKDGLTDHVRLRT